MNTLLTVMPPTEAHGASLPPRSADATAQRMREISRLRARRDAIEAELENVPPGSRYGMDGSEAALARERNRLGEQIEALETLGDGGPRLTVTLDAYASFLVRRQTAMHGATDPADVVNGALAFTAGEDDDHDWPEELHMAAERRENTRGRMVSVPNAAPAGHAVTIRLTPVQLRMFMQIAEVEGDESLAAIVLHELGHHVALHLECYHGHEKEEALARWEREGREAA